MKSNTFLLIVKLKSGINILLNDLLTQFNYGYLAIDIVKDQRDNEKENPLLQLHGLHFLISSKRPFT